MSEECKSIKLSRELMVRVFADAWEQCPEQRFGQFISNLTILVTGTNDSFYMTDLAVLAELKRIAKDGM